MDSTSAAGQHLSDTHIQQKIRNLLMQAPAAVALLEGPDFVYTFANPLYLKLFSRTKAQLLGKTAKEALTGEESLYFIDLFGKVFISGEAVESTEQKISFLEDGEVKTGYYNFKIQPGKDDNGSIIELMVYAHEVTQQVEAIKKAEESENQLQLIADAVPALISYVDKDRRYRFNNNAYESWFGHKRDELNGKHLSEVLGDAVYENIKSNVDEALSGKTVQFENVLRFKDGGDRYVIATYVPHFGADNEVLGFYAEVNEITQQQQSKLALRESEERFQAAVKAVQGVLWTNNSKGEMEGEQPGWAALTGQKSEEYQGYGWSKAVHPEDAQPTIDAWNEAVSARKTFEFQHRLRTVNGEWRLFTIKAVPLFNQDGTIREWVGVHTDVTEQRKMEEALLQSEERYATTIHASDLGLWDFDVLHQQLIGAGKIAAIYGLASNEDYTIEQVFNSIHPDFREEQEKLYSSIINGKVSTSFTTSYPIIQKYSGDVRWIRATAHAFFTAEGVLYRTVGTVSDITDQKKAEEKIKESEERFRLMADASPMMIWTLDAAGNSTYYNKKATDFTGHSEKELLNGTSWQTAIHPDDIGFMTEMVGKALQNRQPYQVECRMKRADGEWRWILSHGMPRLNEKGDLIGYVGSSIEITERKVAEEALKASEDRYQNFIRQSTEGIWRFELEKPLPVTVAKEEQINYFFERAYLAECNDAMARMYGFQQEQELKNFRLADFFPRDADTEAYFMHFIESGYRVQNTESKEMDRHGATKYFSNNLVGIVENGFLLRAWGTQRDITAQKLAEEKLAKSELYFRQLTDTVPAIIWITRPDGYCTYLNNSWYDYTGQTPGEAEGFGWLNATHPDDAAEAERLFVEATIKQKPYYMLYRVRHKSGGYRWAIDSGRPKFGHDGTFDGMIGTVIDVHEQKLAEEVIRRSEEKYRTLFNSLDQGFCTIDVLFDEQGEPYDYRFLEVNPAFVKQTGLENAVGRTMNEFTHLEAFWYKIYGAVAITGKAVRFENRAENLHRFYDVYAFKIGGVEERKVAVLFTDVTQRKMAEMAIKESEDRFRTLADESPIFVFIIEPDPLAPISYWNKTWLQYTGQTEEEARGRAWNGIIHPDDIPIVMKIYGPAFQDRQSYFIPAVRTKRHDGEYRWHAYKGTPRYLPNGQFNGYIGVGFDVHEQKITEERLEILVAERTTELKAANKELSRSNEDLQQFAHVASHDLREPVRKVKTFSSFLEREMEGLLNEKAKQYLRKMTSATDRMYSMIDGVLNYSTINSTDQKPQQVNLNDIVVSIEHDLEITIEKTGAAIRYNDLPIVEGAPVLLYQLFYNLINNSIKFVKAGTPPFISIESKIMYKDDREFAEIAVKDNGIGFEEEQAEKIFDTFTRLNSKDKYEGTGLGLALCKKIVERHGGTITASGKMNEGASFLILLPLKQNER